MENLKFYFFATLLIFLVFWNISVYVIYYLDKQKAIKNKWRTPESFLLLIAFCFGALGALYAIYNVNHKSKKLKFTVLVPLALLINLLSLLAIFYFIFKL